MESLAGVKKRASWGSGRGWLGRDGTRDVGGTVTTKDEGTIKGGMGKRITEGSQNFCKRQRQVVSTMSPREHNIR